MQGIIFNLLETSVQAKYGEDVWDDILELAAVHGAYTSLGSYPDEDLLKLFTVGAQLLKIQPGALVTWLGKSAIPILAKKYPAFFQVHQTTRQFLLTLNSLHHIEVCKLYPGAELPEFEFTASSDGVLVMQYRSHRRLCKFAEGLIEGAADYYHERCTISNLACMDRGDPACVYQITFQA